MAYDIGPRIGIDGEAQFRSALNNISQNIKTLGSEMDVVTSSFLTNEKSIDGLVSQQKILEKQIEAVKEKIKMQAEMAGTAAGKFGATATETLKWERALNSSQTEMNKLKSQLSAVEKEMDDFGKEADDVEDSLEDAGKAGLSFGDVLKANVLSDAIMSGVRALGNAVADLARNFVDFAKTGLETASDLEEVQNVVDTTFGKEGAASIDAFAKQAASAFGMSELSAKQFTGTMGAMLKSMGLNEDAVLDMSTDLAGLAGDMASFYNLDPEEAFAKLRSGISGETEPLKQLGINMSVANLEAYALSQGITTAYKEMTQAEQATLRYNYLMQATADAQGDFAKTSDSYANQQRILQLNMENLGASIGNKLLPYLTGFTSALNGLLSGETDIQTFVSNLSGMVVQAAEGIVQGLPAMAEAAGAIGSSLTSGLQALLPELAPVAAEVISTLIGGLLEQLPAIVESAALILAALASGLGEHLPDLIPAAIGAVTEIATALTSPDSMMQLLEAAGQLIMGLVEGIFAAIPDLISSVPVIIENLVSTITNPENQTASEDAGKKFLGSLITGLLSAVSSLVQAAGDIVLILLREISYAVGDMFGIGRDVIDGFWRGIKEKWEQLKAWLSNAVDSLVGGVKNLLGIHSPSRVFAGIGGYMAEGLGLGFEDKMDKVSGQIQKAIPTPTMEIGGIMAGAVNGMQTAMAGMAGGGSYTFNLMLPDGTTLARYQLPALIDVAKSSGTPILNPT